MPDDDVATMAQVSDAAATVGGMPIITIRGNSRKPPPHAEQSGEETHKRAGATNRKHVHANPCYGEENHHDWLLTSLMICGFNILE